LANCGRWRYEERVKIQGGELRRKEGSLLCVRQRVRREKSTKLPGKQLISVEHRKSAQKKEQITVPASLSLNIEGPQRSVTILARKLQGGEVKVLCTSEEMREDK
jgi:hypothetical protein